MKTLLTKLETFYLLMCPFFLILCVSSYNSHFWVPIYNQNRLTKNESNRLSFTDSIRDSKFWKNYSETVRSDHSCWCAKHFVRNLCEDLKEASAEFDNVLAFDQYSLPASFQQRFKLNSKTCPKVLELIREKIQELIKLAETHLEVPHFSLSIQCFSTSPIFVKPAAQELDVLLHALFDPTPKGIATKIKDVRRAFFENCPTQ